MVGTCTALHLQQRGFDVTLVDRRAPGQETSMGNAGLIQREAVEPYAFPREPGFLLDVALGRADRKSNRMRAIMAPVWVITSLRAGSAWVLAAGPVAQDLSA